MRAEAALRAAGGVAGCTRGAQRMPARAARRGAAQESAARRPRVRRPLRRPQEKKFESFGHAPLALTVPLYRPLGGDVAPMDAFDRIRQARGAPSSAVQAAAARAGSGGAPSAASLCRSARSARTNCGRARPLRASRRRPRCAAVLLHSVRALGAHPQRGLCEGGGARGRRQEPHAAGHLRRRRCAGTEGTAQISGIPAGSV